MPYCCPPRLVPSPAGGPSWPADPQPPLGGPGVYYPERENPGKQLLVLSNHTRITPDASLSEGNVLQSRAGEGVACRTRDDVHQRLCRLARDGGNPCPKRIPCPYNPGRVRDPRPSWGALPVGDPYCGTSLSPRSLLQPVPDKGPSLC